MMAILKVIFRWFYCLPISDAVFLVSLTTLLYLLLRKGLGETGFWKGTIPILLSGWLFVIFFGTLGQRMADTEPLKPILLPFYSYYAAFNGGERELLRESFMNVVLFHPAGLLAGELLPKHWKRATRVLLTVAIFATVSIVIEFCQYHFLLGLVETDDVLHNTFGALLGALASMISLKVKSMKNE